MRGHLVDSIDEIIDSSKVSSPKQVINDTHTHTHTHTHTAAIVSGGLAR